MGKYKTAFTVKPDTSEPGFSLVTDEIKIQNLIREAIEQKAPLILGTPKQKDLFRSNFLEQSDAKQVLCIAQPEGYAADSLAQQLRRENISECLLVVLLKNQSTIGLECAYLGSEPGLYKFMPPKKAFRAQRRRDYRYEISRGYDLRVDLADPQNLQKRISLRLMDVSMGGLSFTAPAAQAKSFFEGMITRNVSVRIQNRVILLDAEVRSNSPLDPKNPTGEQKVGLLFRRIKEEDEAFLAIYVTEHAIQFWPQL